MSEQIVVLIGGAGVALVLLIYFREHRVDIASKVLLVGTLVIVLTLLSILLMPLKKAGSNNQGVTSLDTAHSTNSTLPNQTALPEAIITPSVGQVDTPISRIVPEASMPAPVQTATLITTLPSQLAPSSLSEAPMPTITPPPVAASTPPLIMGTVRVLGGNVRSSPRLANNIIGFVNQGDEVIFLGASSGWYLIRLGGKKAQSSTIHGDQGWVSRYVVSQPSAPPPLVTLDAQP